MSYCESFFFVVVNMQIKVVKSVVVKSFCLGNFGMITSCF